VKNYGAVVLASVVSCFCTVAILGALGFSPGQDEIPEVVRARAFHVVGKDGTVLVKLEDTGGNRLGIGEVGMITTYNEKGKELVKLFAHPFGAGKLRIRNGKGRETLVLGASPNGNGSLLTLDGEGEVLVALATSANGTGVVIVGDPKGNEGDGTLSTQAP